MVSLELLHDSYAMPQRCTTALVLPQADTKTIADSSKQLPSREYLLLRFLGQPGSLAGVIGGYRATLWPHLAICRNFRPLAGFGKWHSMCSVLIAQSVCTSA